MTRFVVSRSVLSVLASRAGSVVPTSAGYKSSAQNLRIEVSDSPPLLRLTGTDMELTVVTSTPAVQQVTDPGEILVEARPLLEILGVATGDQVTLSTLTDAQKRPVVRVEAGGTHWDLRRKDEKFPAIPEFPEGTTWAPVSREHLVGSVKAVRHAVSKNGSYPAWACVSILPDTEKDTSGQVRTLVMASDMTRAQFAEIPQARLTEGDLAEPAYGAGFPFACSIPAAGGAVAEVLKVLSAVDLPVAEVAQTDSALAFRVGSTTIAVVKMHARPADIRRKLVRAVARNTLSLAVKRDDLAGAVRRVRVLADDTTPVIGLRCEAAKLTVLGQDKYRQYAEQAITATWGGEDERLLFVNATFLADMLAVHPSEACEFLVAPDGKDKKGSDILLRDEATGITGIIPQMASEAARLGYE